MADNVIEIPKLYKLQRSDRERLVLTYMSAFERYPKLMFAFPDRKVRLHALEATIRYYTAYDLTYGAGFSLDEDLTEAVLLVHSDRMKYTRLKHLFAGSYDKDYRHVISKLSQKDQRTRERLFEELDCLEKTVDIPKPHLYVDFLGVAEECQGQGRGTKLMGRVCSYADRVSLPIMLFTNTDDDIRFYEKLGFRIIGKTHSHEFGFTNTYMLYER